MKTKTKSRAAKPEFHPGDETLLEVAGSEACIGNLNRNTFKCDLRVEGIIFTIICPMSMVTYFGENAPVALTVGALEVLATKQFFEELRNKHAEDN
jgi:hypothetical protein